MAESNGAIAQIKAVYEDGFAEINGRRYDFGPTNHIKRRTVFAYLTKIQDDLENGNFWFLDSSDFQKVEKIIADIVLFDGMQISKIGGHWNEYPQDYVMYVSTALGVVSYPFLAASPTD